MELQSAAAAKRLWNFLRFAFFTVRKGLISKRKLVMEMNVMLKRSGKMMGKNLGASSHGYGLQEYEFSCATSPNPVCFHGNRGCHNYFSCLNPIVKDSETPKRPAVAVPRIEYASEEEEEAAEADVDDKAEDFIKRFYEQLRIQNHIALIEYQEATAE